MTVQRVCRVCGCSDEDACVTVVDGVPIACHWIELDLCSECA